MAQNEIVEVSATNPAIIPLRVILEIIKVLFP